MIYPFRMNMVRIKIAQLNTTTTQKDPDFREAVGVKHYSTPIELEGQVNLATKPKYFMSAPSRTGDMEPTRGKLVFRKRDLTAAGVTLQKGDKIIEVGPVSDPTPIDCELVEVRPESPLRGDFLLIVAEFEWDQRERGSIIRGAPAR
jgi:hypothetical protein